MAGQRRLNRDIVIETAVTMANETGNYETVTLMALAKTVDVRMPSLYNHISSLDDLHQSMAVYGLRELIQRLREASFGLAGQPALLAMAAAYRQFAHDFPGIYPLAICAPEAEEASLLALAQELTQMLLLVFASFGLEGEAAQHAMRGYRALLHGFTALEAAGGYRLPLSKEASFHDLLTTYLAGLDARRT